MVGFIIIINACSKSPAPPDLFLEEITKRNHPAGAQGSLPLRAASFEILDYCFGTHLPAPHPVKIGGSFLPKSGTWGASCLLHFLSPAGSPVLRHTQYLAVTSSLTTGGKPGWPNSTWKGCLRSVPSFTPGWGCEPSTSSTGARLASPSQGKTTLVTTHRDKIELLMT